MGAVAHLVIGVLDRGGCEGPGRVGHHLGDPIEGIVGIGQAGIRIGCTRQAAAGVVGVGGGLLRGDFRAEPVKDIRIF